MESVANTGIHWKVAAASVRGKMHIRTGLPNQDACDSAQHGGNTVLAVADGHGNSRHFRSQTGSALAVRSALAVLGSLAAHCSLVEAAKRIEEAWRVAVQADLERNPFTASDWATLAHLSDGPLAVEAIQESPAIAYGATLAWTRHKQHPWHRTAEQGLAPIATGLILAGAFSVLRASSSTWTIWALAAIALGVFLSRPKMNPLIVLFAAGLVNVIIGHIPY